MENNTENGFKPIETQDELNAIIKDRLAREREASNKRFEGYISPDEHAKAIASEKKLFEDYKKAHEGDAKTIEELTAKVSGFELDAMKTRIAREVGLSYDWVGRIGGTDEKTIREDAENLKKLVGYNSPTLPTKNTEAGQSVDPTTAALREVLHNTKKQ